MDQKEDKEEEEDEEDEGDDELNTDGEAKV